jgi:hypothetical protein
MGLLIAVASRLALALPGLILRKQEIELRNAKREV